MDQLKRFFSPPVADAIVSAGENSILAPHRREICYVFVDLRGFTAFTDSAEPEEVQAVLHDYHARDGGADHRARGHARPLRRRRHPDLLQRPDADPRARRSARRAMALAMQAALRAAARSAGRSSATTSTSAIGIAKGFATLGAFGFEGRFDYSAIGGVVNLAARLCSEAQPGQILIDRRARAALDDDYDVEAVGPLALKGYAQPVPAFLLRAPKPRECVSRVRRTSTPITRRPPRARRGPARRRR